MQQLLSNLISAPLQVAVFALVPFIFFLFRKDKTVNFPKYIGLYLPSSNKYLKYMAYATLLILGTGTGLVFLNEDFKKILLTAQSVTGQLHQAGLSLTTILSLLVIACIKTSLSEEILFRGFIAKRLVRRLGFGLGNLLQALIFGIVHFLLFFSLVKVSILSLVMVFAMSSLAGWIIGYIKEKHADSSIIPGWVAHALGNTISYFVIAFILS
ncbi:MAG TPA: CPBP family intramembrane glutamic endopeptidase [Candidatus Udaeobacter sp.]|nr:CPBP family intramembrane glutamic endopeptidase [Candidatus Udaeobacter sp.]